MKLSSGLRNSKVETLRLIFNMFLLFLFLSQNVSTWLQHFPLCRLKSCSLTERSSNDLASFVSSASCLLKLLDLSDNEFHDLGVKRFSDGLRSSDCKLETLKWVSWVWGYVLVQRQIQTEVVLVTVMETAGWNNFLYFLKFVPVQCGRRGLHFLGICFKLMPPERAGHELQPPRELRVESSNSSERGPTMQPGETQVVMVSTTSEK